jgi:hypothetical protein
MKGIKGDMTADGGRSKAFAPQVCAICKARKKKCDKLLSSCGYGIRQATTSPIH